MSKTLSFADDAWDAGAFRFRHRCFPAGAHVVEAGRVTDQLFFLTSGLARYYYLSKNGREVNKSFSVTGQVLSSASSLVEGKPSPFNVQALLPSTCLSITYSDFCELADGHRGWAQLRLRLLEQLVLKKERREADFLLLSATERYQQFLTEYAHIVDVLPNYHIASYLGITEVALSRIRRRLKLTRVNAAKR